MYCVRTIYTWYIETLNNGDLGGSFASRPFLWFLFAAKMIPGITVMASSSEKSAHGGRSQNKGNSWILVVVAKSRRKKVLMIKDVVPEEDPANFNLPGIFFHHLDIPAELVSGFVLSRPSTSRGHRCHPFPPPVCAFLFVTHGVLIQRFYWSSIFIEYQCCQLPAVVKRSRASRQWSMFMQPEVPARMRLPTSLYVHSIRLEQMKLVEVGTRITYQATGADADTINESMPGFTSNVPDNVVNDTMVRTYCVKNTHTIISTMIIYLETRATWNIIISNV